jgi:hypothetical protein
MRDDLLHAQATVDWAISQFPSLQERINAWVELNIEVVIEDPDPNGPDNIIVAVAKEPLPLAFNVEIGAYLGATRASLDILATTLAIRYRVGKPDDANFPVANSDTAFAVGKYKGAKFVKGLPATQRALIEGLKPYKGGNEPLWSLHHLDIMRKHRRLLAIVVDPYIFGVIGAGAHKFTPPTGFVRADNAGQKKVVLGSIAKDAPEYETQFIPYVALDEAALVERRSLDRSFGVFTSVANYIIRLFDI